MLLLFTKRLSRVIKFYHDYDTRAYDLSKKHEETCV